MTSRRGAFIVLIGPDGVGKTSVSAELREELGARYFHFRPTLFGTWSEPRPGEVLEKPEHRPGRAESVLRLALAFFRFWLGYLSRIAPELASGRHVLGDRWAYGYLVKPEELRYAGPRTLASLMVRLLPEPSAVVCLTAPPAVIRARKPELSIAEIERDLVKWRSVPARNLIELEAIEAPPRIAAELVDRLGLR